MTPSSATGLDEKALEAARKAFAPDLFGDDPQAAHQDASPYSIEAAQLAAKLTVQRVVAAYMSALSVTSFPPAEQHDVTSHAVPLSDGEGAVAPFAWAWKWASGGEWRLFGAGTSEAARADFIRDMERTAPIVVKAVYDHPAPVAAQPAEGWEAVKRALSADGAQTDQSRALALLGVEDARQEKLHDLLETIREQIRNGVAPEYRPEGLFENIQAAVYTMRGRTRLVDDAAITNALASSPTPPTAPAVPAGVREVLKGLERFAQFTDGWGDEVIGLKQHPTGDYVKWSDILHVIQALPAQPNSSEGEPT